MTVVCPKGTACRVCADSASETREMPTAVGRVPLCFECTLVLTEASIYAMENGARLLHLADGADAAQKFAWKFVNDERGQQL